MVGAVVVTIAAKQGEAVEVAEGIIKIGQTGEKLRKLRLVSQVCHNS